MPAAASSAVDCEWKEVPGMSEHAFSLTGGIVFLLIALGHFVRIMFGMPFVVQGIAVPLWMSGVAILIAGFLSYEGFHFARRPGSK